MLPPSLTPAADSSAIDSGWDDSFVDMTPIWTICQHCQ
jgi:hypothetical protein